uniref:ComEC-like protein n=1 Tax=Alkalihalophilus pseudofirmus TaxID=79885 RepID=Q3S856_ALKPS|nr:ComEC-like protein [Alkalihalophilus pseudofirmus]
MRTVLFTICLMLLLSGCSEISQTSEEKTVKEIGEKELIVTFLDVDQGDATLLQTKDSTVLIDAGRHDRDEVVSLLKEAGVTEIDLFVELTHMRDHIGQVAQVLAEFPVAEVWMSGDDHTTRTFERAIQAIADSVADYYEPRAGEEFEIGSLTIEVINPTELTGDFHEGAIGLRMVHGEIAWLFMADIEKEIELELVDNGVNLQADVIKLGHHGSSTSSEEAFLRKVDPMYAVYSAGADNEYGHPHREVIERIDRLNLEWYGTDLHGSIQMISDGSSISIHTENNQQSALNEDVPSDSCININEASIDELTMIVHIGEERAQQLIDMRPITNLNELTDINGIGDGRLSEIIEEELACLKN